MTEFDITRDLIRSDEYSYLTDTKTVLWITKPSVESNRGFSSFFCFGGLAVAAGVLQQGGNVVVVWIAAFIALYAGWFLVRSFIPQRNKAADWVLYVGSGEMPLELYRSSDKAVFDAKREEIERALISRPTE